MFGIRILIGIIESFLAIALTVIIFTLLNNYKAKLDQLQKDGKEKEAEKLSNIVHTIVSLISIVCFIIAALLMSGKIK